MILKWIQKMLSRRLNQKKQDVIRLRWKQAQLQQRLAKMKTQQTAENESGSDRWISQNDR